MILHHPKYKTKPRPVSVLAPDRVFYINNMEAEQYFDQAQVNWLLISNLGIHVNKWIDYDIVSFNKSNADAAEIMRKYSIDILPLKDSIGTYNQYATTSKSGDYVAKDIVLKDINLAKESIYYLTHVKDVIRLMVEKERWFYFLSNHTSVVGIVTLSDFNKKQLYPWLYQKLVDLEQNLSRKLCSEFSLIIILQKIEQLSLGPNAQGKSFKDPWKRYQKDKKKNSDAGITEYIFLSQFIVLFKEFGLYKKLGYSSCTDFENAYKSLKNIRNTIAHPTKSLISDHSSLIVLWNGIQKMDELNQRLTINH